MRIYRCTSFLILAMATINQAFAANIGVAGKTASISDGFINSAHKEGSHFHAGIITALPAGNPSIIDRPWAEVGGFFGDEEVRGIAEFSLQETARTATVLFDVLDLFAEQVSTDPSGIDGLFAQGPYVGTIDVFAYGGNNMEDLSDYQIAPLSDTPLLSIEVGQGLITAGETLSIDVTDVYNSLVAAGNQPNAATALGLRLQMAPPADPNSGAITFSNFRLQVQNIPEPEASWLLLLAVAAVLRRTRRV